MNPIALRLHEIGLTMEATGHEEIVMALGVAEREILRLEALLARPEPEPTPCWVHPAPDAALQARHAEALAEKDRRIASLEENETVIYDSFAICAELPRSANLTPNQVSAVLDTIARIWKRLP